MPVSSFNIHKGSDSIVSFNKKDLPLNLVSLLFNVSKHVNCSLLFIAYAGFSSFGEIRSKDDYFFLHTVY